jgi:hypothetical protein
MSNPSPRLGYRQHVDVNVPLSQLTQGANHLEPLSISNS